MTPPTAYRGDASDARVSTAAADRKRAETEALARQLAADLTASLGHQDAHEILRAEMNAAIAAKLETHRQQVAPQKGRAGDDRPRR